MPTALPQDFWALDIWTDESKSTPITGSSINRLTRVYRKMAVNTPYSHEITCFLSDARTKNLARGYYYELTCSKTSTRTMWARGLIQTLTKGGSTGGGTDDLLQITGASASIALTHQRLTGALAMGPGIGYNSVLDAFNGVNPVGGAYPPDHKGILTGTGWTAQWKDGIGTTTPPGSGDVWRGDWDTSWHSLIGLAQHYNFFVREKVGVSHLTGGGVLEVGPLNDASGVTIWGGNSLLVDMQTNHGYPATAQYPDAGRAQQLGYAVIAGASWQDNLANIVNICWALGKGKPEDGGCTLRSFGGGTPADGSGNAINGWAKYQPNTAAGGRVYYYKTQSKTTYSGSSFFLVATQQQDAQWAYGVMNKTSVDSYGAHEYVLINHGITNPDLLLSAALGAVEYNSDPIPSFEFIVNHPLTSATGVPVVPSPGQSVVVNYSGQVHQAIETDLNTLSPTFGQWVPAGSYTYLAYPGVSDSSKITKLKRCVSIEDTWENDTYQQKLTMGQGHWKWKHWADEQARKMEKNLHRRPVQHRWSKKPFEGVQWLFSNAYDHENGDELVINPGGFAVSDVPGTHYFDDHHQVSFSFSISNTTQGLRFLFGFTTPTAPTLNTGTVYGGFQIAASASGLASGFFTTSDGTTLTARGSFHAGGAFNSSRRLQTLFPSVCHVRLHGNKYEAMVNWNDSGQIQWEHHCATWNDTGVVLNPAGAIGFALVGGTQAVTITGVSARGLHAHIPPKNAITVAEMHGTHPSRKTRRITSAQYAGGAGIILPKAV